LSMKKVSKETFEVILRFLVSAVTNVLFLFLFEGLKIEFALLFFTINIHYIVASLLGGVVMGLISTETMRNIAGNLASISAFLGTIIYLIIKAMFLDYIQIYFFYFLIPNGLISMISGWIGGLAGSKILGILK